MMLSKFQTAKFANIFPPVKPFDAILHRLDFVGTSHIERI